MKNASLVRLFKLALAAAAPVATASYLAACGGCDTPGGFRVLLTGDAGTILDSGPDGGIDCDAACHGQTQQCELEDGGAAILCERVWTCVGGRLPGGIVLDNASHRGGSTGAYLASLAYLEAASVDAFSTFAKELRTHGAPTRLWRAARRSRRDEIRHARQTRALARRYGARPCTPQVRSLGHRSLVTIGIENAVEGCVRETFAALVAHYQAAYATDPHVRATMQQIARDETRHAALAWEAGEWLYARLGRDERIRIEEAVFCAVKELRESVPREGGETVSALGLPSSEAHAALIDSLSRRLWGRFARYA